MRLPVRLIVGFALCFGSYCAAASDAPSSCLQQALASATDATTIGSLRAECDKKSPKVLAQRARKEGVSYNNPFTITAHKPNYLLPISYNVKPRNLDLYGYELQRSEIKFQISFKFPIGTRFWHDRIQVYGAYTNQSWWQAFNDQASAPFRETNHEPELFAVMPLQFSQWGFEAAALGLGISHQSNGQSGLRSRSWNRIYASAVFEREGWVLGLKPWIRLQEDAKTSPNDPKGDDNPDIEDFTGHFELGLFRRFNQQHSLSAIVRHNFSSHKGAIQLGYSYPLNGRFKGYVEIFDGYAESMIDYNHHTTRLGVGVLLTDWL